MCGIAGFVGRGEPAIIEAMTTVLYHRGPDGAGYHVDTENQVYLGHRRLAIIDLHDGKQPMWDSEQTTAVIFNGEIYNHRQLRQQLKQYGHVFVTDHSDTEVLVHGYKQWGTDLPNYLQGMFAFAIYDKHRQKIFIARDRFGKKPLYYTQLANLFAFASEIKALRQHPLFNITLNQRSLQKYFAYGFLPAPHSQYENTYKLPGGHYLVYDLATKKITIKEYWQFRIESDARYLSTPESEICEQLRSLLAKAVQARLLSDVPLGIFLSGGLDSSAVLAFAAELLPANEIKTFAIGFTEKSYDESSYAKQMADYFGTDHHTEILPLQYSKQLIPKILSQLDEPLADASILPTYLVSEFARRNVTVALGGDGGDELFAGYDPFRALKLASWYQRWVPRACHRGLQRLVHWLPISTSNMSLDFKLRRTLQGLNYSEKVWNPVWLSPLSVAELSDLFNEPVAADDLYSEAIQLWESSQSKHVIDRSLEFYTRLYLQDDILTKVDRAAMMVSLECRAPFLDYDLVEFVRKLPWQLKYRHGTTKYILKKALQTKLPRNILQRKKKGFGIPLASWLREIPKSPPLATIAASNSNFVNNHWQQHRSQTADHRLFLWSWLVMQYQLNPQLAVEYD